MILRVLHTISHRKYYQHETHVAVLKIRVGFKSELSPIDYNVKILKHK